MTRLSGLRAERVRASRQFRDGAFHNTQPVGAGIKGNPLPVLGEFFFGGKGRTPTAPLPVESPLASWLRAVSSGGLRITWLGHSTLLIEMDGAVVLTDPVFGARASPFSFAGPKRFHEVPVTLAQLPRLDAVLLSHDHYDHLCESTVRELAKMQVPFVTSLGVGAHLEAYGVNPVVITELDWWENTPFRARAFPSRRLQRSTFQGAE